MSGASISARSMPKRVLLLTLNMSHVLFRTSALKVKVMPITCHAVRSLAYISCPGSYCYAFNERSIQPAGIVDILSRSPTRRFASSRPPGSYYNALHNRAAYPAAGMIYHPPTRHFASSVDDTPSEGDEQPPPTKSKPKSRKQRRRAREQLKLTRIDKLLAHRGVGSRSQVFELAKARRITYASYPDAPHEERTRIASPKEKVPFDSSLFLDGALLPGPPPLLLVYHKPKYVLSVMDDEKYKDQERKHLGQVLDPKYVKAGMHPVGRLDYDTTGLILFSRDGQLTQSLLHPRRGVPKEYVATVQGLADEAELRQKLSEGVKTSEGTHKAELLGVTPSDGPVEDEDLDELLETDTEGGKESKVDSYSGPYSDVRLVVKEGKHRMVRRILANCGHPVVELRRERHGEVELGDLEVGSFREPTEEEREWAESLIGK